MIVPCRSAGGLPRRKFLAFTIKASVVAAAVIGGLVKFSPSAFALSCDFGFDQLTQDCAISCLGDCSNVSSCCTFGDNPSIDFACVGCLFECPPGSTARVIVVCSPNDDTGYYCGHYC